MAGERVEAFVQSYGQLEREVHKVIVGHDEIVDQVLVALFAGGHVLLEASRGSGRPFSSGRWPAASTSRSRGSSSRPT
jgi:MoxR-like ATPase